MARTNNLSEFLTDVAQSIKDKKGITGKIPAANFDTEISTIETGIDTSDATATAADIKSGSTAYAKDTKLTGTLTFDKFDPDYTNCLNKASQIEGTVPLKNPYFTNTVGINSITDIRHLITAIPELDTSNVTNMDSMFSNCSNLTSIPELNTSKVTNMHGMFNSCTNLIFIPLLNTINVTDMSNMFTNCTNLTTIPQLNTSKVTNMRSMFFNCTNLTEIPVIDTSKVINMDYMFKYCTSLTNISSLDTSKVEQMSYMFSDCKNLTIVPLLDTSKIRRNLNGIFLDCPNLSDESLNNILQMCINAKAYTEAKTLRDQIGLSQEQATKCATLSNWQAFTAAGWTSGY